MALEQRDSSIIGEINITPLTDVMLALLIMFLLTATFLLGAHVMEVELPAPIADTAPPPADVGRIAIRVDRQGRLFVGGRPVADERLTAAMMEEAARIRADRKVVEVKADPEAAYGRVIWIMDSARLVGLPLVSLAAAEATGADDVAAWEVEDEVAQ